MIIQHNISAINSRRNTANTQRGLSKDLERLSSGYKINRAGDDAAGLAISEGMRAQIAALNRAEKNAQDGISLVQTVEGALTEVHSMLNRMKTMATQAANGTYEDKQREMLNEELQQLKEEIDRIGSSTSFSGVDLFTNGKSGSSTRQTSIIGVLDLANHRVEVNQLSRTGGIASTGGYDALADKIATEYFPNAITQILNAFPSLKAEVGSDKIGMELHMEYIDGENNTLAFAYAMFHVNGKPFDMNITVDTSDFSDESIQSGSPDLERLESTIAHELMHSVMQYTLPDGMSGRGGKEEFPTWFVEGTAQLAGGGFPTNWNNRLKNIVGGLTGSTDGSGDAAIREYLKAYDVEERPYGHGYLAAAYIGYLASGRAGVTSADIAKGMDKVFGDLAAGQSLYNVLSHYTGGKIHDLASLEGLFDNPDSDLTQFVRELSWESRNGAGSIIAGNLSDGGDNIIGNSQTGNAAFYVNKIVIGSTGKLQLTIGYNNTMEVQLFRLDSRGLHLADTDLLKQKSANRAMDSIEAAINQVSGMRSHYGAVQNRLDHAINNLNTTTENLTSAESRIRDTDMAMTITQHTRNQILLQCGQAMLAQANQTPGGVLGLLGA